MFPSFKYLSSFLSYKIHSLVGGTNIKTLNTELKTKKNRELTENTKIKNKKLARELETECRKKGYLTFAEFMQRSQFGNHGYYANHNYHGMTDTYLRWPKAIVELCKKEKINHIVEFGCGDGRLALETLKIANGKNIDLSYTGIEINEEEIKKAEEMFKREGIPKTLYEFIQSDGSRLDNYELSTINNKPCLLLFSYSLDSIPPELFVNEEMIGIKVENGMLSECLMPLPPGGSASWRIGYPPLHPRQRIFLPVEALRVLDETVKKLPKKSVCIILDEFSPPPLSWSNQTQNMPKDLEKYDPARKVSFSELYKNAGSQLLYFPAPVELFINVLKIRGLSVYYDNERLTPENIYEGKDIPEAPKEKSVCYAIIGIKKHRVEIPELSHRKTNQK